MIVKFYKGPWHNKKRVLPDNETSIVIQKPGGVVWASDDFSPRAQMPHRGYYTRTRHTHPDGSVFFEWSGWRR